MPSPTLTETELIAACVRGEHRAQRQLFDQLAGLMLTVCRRYLRRREDAEEALLLGFAKVFRALPAYRFAGSFEGWVRRIMVNEALMQLRQREILTLSLEDFAQPDALATTAATAETGLQGELGYHALRLFARYHLNEVFRDGRGPQAHVLSFGLRVVGF